MQRLAELSSIYPQKRATIQNTLDLLVSQKLITGYNWYTETSRQELCLSVSHLHESEAYKLAMLRDLEALGYSRTDLTASIRAKYTTFRWDKKFIIRDEHGTLLPGLHLRVGNQKLDLDDFINQTLEEEKTSLIQ